MAQTKVTTGGITDSNVTNSKLGTDISADKIASGTIPTARLGSGTANSSTFLAGDQTYKSISEYDDSQVQSNIAMLGFKVATNGSLSKYNLVDQAIDEYNDTTGIDTSNSTNDNRSGSSPYYYSGVMSNSPTITNGTATVDGSDTYVKYTTVGTGTIVPQSNLTVEYVIVAGGGGGGYSNAGGGGAGGYLANNSKALSLSNGTTYTVTVGAGGNGGSNGVMGTNGGDSSLSGSGLTTITAIGGGRGGQGGGNASDQNGAAGGSGGGGYYNGGNGGSPTAGQGYIGGGQTTTSPEHGAGGGGGASEAGEGGLNNKGGDGGDGVANDITGSSVTYAGGGGGSSDQTTSNSGNGGAGGGGEGASKDNDSDTYCDATVNTGGGGGSHYKSGSGSTNVTRGGHGGSGIVILRYTTPAETAGDMTLLSTATTAETTPTKGDIVMLMENGAGTATLNTDIKAYISRDNGTTYTQGTLVDEGTWGTNKKILAFHNLDISAQPSGTSLKYKIETLNQSGAKNTRIYATSLGWS